MSKETLQSKGLGPLIAWVTPCVKVVQVLSFWVEDIKRCYFIPCKKRGFVVFTHAGETVGCIPAQGYILIRPTSLRLHWPIDRLVEFRRLSKIAALEWRAKAHRRWKIISKINRESEALPWWA